MDALIIVDMQCGLLLGSPKHDLDGVVSRINALSAHVRRAGGNVIWIRHCGDDGDVFARHAPGWELLPDLIRADSDLVVEKTLNDPFAGTVLGETLVKLDPGRVIVVGWATDFCVDATVRSSVSNGFDVVAVSDGHTLSDRPHLAAAAVIVHHNAIWAGLISRRTVRVMSTRTLLDEAARDVR